MPCCKIIHIDPRVPIRVSGATGHVAAALIQHLLQQGLTVHATVHDPCTTVTRFHRCGTARCRDSRDASRAFALMEHQTTSMRPGRFPNAAPSWDSSQRLPPECDVRLEHHHCEKVWRHGPSRAAIPDLTRRQSSPCQLHRWQICIVPSRS